PAVPAQSPQASTEVVHGRLPLDASLGVAGLPGERMRELLLDPGDVRGERLLDTCEVRVVRGDPLRCGLVAQPGGQLEGAGACHVSPVDRAKGRVWPAEGPLPQAPCLRIDWGYRRGSPGSPRFLISATSAPVTAADPVCTRPSRWRIPLETRSSRSCSTATRRCSSSRSHSPVAGAVGDSSVSTAELRRSGSSSPDGPQAISSAAIVSGIPRNPPSSALRASFPNSAAAITAWPNSTRPSPPVASGT